MQISTQNKVRIIFWIVFLAVAVFLGVKLGVEGYSVAKRTYRYEPVTAYEHYKHGKKIQGEWKLLEAEKYLLKAIELDPDFGRAYVELGHLYAILVYPEKELEYNQAALNVLDINISNDKENRGIVYYNLGGFYARRGKYADVEKSWNNYVKSFELIPQRTELFSDNPNKFVYYVKNNDKREFVKRVRESHRDKTKIPNNLVGWDERLRRLLDQEKYREVIEEGERFINTHPDNNYNYVFSKVMVWAYYEENRLEEMFKHLKLLDAEENLAKNIKPWMKLMYVYYYKDIEEYDEALLYADEIIKDYREYKDLDLAYYQKALILKKLQNIEEEVKVLREIAKRNSSRWYSSFAYTRLSFIEQYRENYSESYSYRLKSGVSEFNYFLSSVLGNVFFCAIGVLFFFVIVCVFYPGKRKEIKGKEYKFRHYFFYGLIKYIVPVLMFWGFMAYSYYYLDIFSMINLNPVMLVECFSSVIMVAFVLYLLRKVYKLRSSEMGFKLGGIKRDLFLPLVLCVGFFLVQAGYMQLLDYLKYEMPENTFESMAQIVFTRGHVVNRLIMIVMIVIVAPIAEEIVYRIFLIKYIRKFTSIKFAVIFSAAVFAIGHEPAAGMPIFFIVGITLGVLYVRTRSIVPCIILHIMNNSAEMYFHLMP